MTIRAWAVGWILGWSGFVPTAWGLTVHEAQLFLSQKKLCSFAVAPVRGDQIMGPVLCMTDVMFSKDSIQENLGCGLAVIQIPSGRLEGEPGAKITNAQTCADGGFERLVSFKGDLLIESKDRYPNRVVYAASPRYENWWKRTYPQAWRKTQERWKREDRIREQKEALKKRCLIRGETRQKNWKYDRDAQFELGPGAEKKGQIRYRDRTPECERWRAQFLNGKSSSPVEQ